IAIGICALMAASGVYYAFFSCFVLFVAGVWAAIQQRSVRPLFPCGAFLAIISIVGLAQFSPTILHHLRHGDNPDAVARSLDDAETFALKVDNLLLPMPSHRLQNLIHPPYTEGYNFGTN